MDIDKNFQKVLKVADKVVIPLGELGCFDEHGIFPVNIVRNKDKVLAYTTGWNRKVSVSADASIGLAISEDEGMTFKKLGAGPVLTASLHEPFLVCDGFVAIFANVYHMWYIFGTTWSKFSNEEAPDRVYKIAHATSDDGINWVRDGKQVIKDKLNADECQALPTVVALDDKYIMLFCYRHATDFRNNKERGYRLGYAYSKDLVNWTRDDDNIGIELSDGEWDSDMMCYPHLFKCDEKTYLLYNGNEFGRFGFGLAVLEN